jgi:four helix bundle protein
VMVHKLVDESPERRGWRIVDQLSRAVVSVPSNIAEGNARGTPRDYANFISIAKGSLMESETLILSAVRLEYVPASAAQPTLDLIIEVSKMLTTLRSRLLKQR